MQILSTRPAFFRRPLPALPVAAALVLAASLFFSPVRTLADQFLTIFRAQDFTLVEVDPTAFGRIPDLTQFGEMEGNPAAATRPRVVADTGAAAAAAGYAVRQPARVPAGWIDRPSAVAVTDATDVRFTFRAEKARAYLEAAGRTDFSLPPRFDGATLRLHLSPAVLLSYTRSGAEAPGPSRLTRRAPDLLAAVDEIYYGQVRAPELEASGVTAEEFREFLLSIPGIPPTTLAQLKTIGDWRTTVPLPVPQGVAARKTQVNGAPAALFLDRALNLGGIVWLKDGMEYAIAGPLSESQLLEMAGSVR